MDNRTAEPLANQRTGRPFRTIFTPSLCLCPLSFSEVYPDTLTLRPSQIRYRGSQQMDLLYVAGIVGFCVLIALLVVGCDKLKRAPGGRP
jgi:hypothetical protein